MSGHAERRQWPASMVVSIVVVLAPAVTACSHRAAAVSQHAAHRLTITAVNGDRLQVPGNRPLVMDFVSAGCTTGLATLARARMADPGADYVAIDVGPSATSSQLRAILAASGATGLATTIDPRGEVTASYRVLQSCRPRMARSSTPASIPLSARSPPL